MRDNAHLSPSCIVSHAPIASYFHATRSREPLIDKVVLVKRMTNAANNNQSICPFRTRMRNKRPNTLVSIV